jgi:predicted nucleic-acid-binding protein
MVSMVLTSLECWAGEGAIGTLVGGFALLGIVKLTGKLFVLVVVLLEVVYVKRQQQQQQQQHT